MNITSPVIIGRDVTAVTFASYTTEEIQQLSVKRITSPILFDQLNHPNKGGLYDPALGPLDRSSLYVGVGRARACGGAGSNVPSRPLPPLPVDAWLGVQHAL